MSKSAVKQRAANGMTRTPVPEELVSRDATLTQLMVVYLHVSAAVVGAWVFGVYQFSFVWIFLIISALFAVWRSILKRIIKKRLVAEETLIHRKRALKQSETGEWLNFLLNRWWVFSANSIEDVVKKHINERLKSVKPSFVSHLELMTFTFGEATPAMKYVQAFEISEGVPGGRRPVAWNSMFKPPTGLDRMSNYHVVVEIDLECHHEDFMMAFRSKVGSGRAGLTFDIAVEELGITGNLQVILHMSMDVPFPHISKATISFTQEPQLWFNIRILKSLQIMEIPLLKTWLHTHITDGLSKALVDPGKIDIQVAKAGPIHMSNAVKGKDSKQRLAEGVLTLTLNGHPVKDAKPDDERYTMLKLGNKKRQTPNVMAADEWEDVCSFFVYNLASEKLIVKSKRRGLLSNVTLQRHEVELSSFPLQLNSGSTTTVDNTDGSSVDIKMQYTALPPIPTDFSSITEQPEINQVAGVMYVCVHSASNLIASDKGGTSDPYCVVFCDRRRVLTTPYILKNRSPVWESAVEFFVRDFTKATLSFYVFDWDGINVIDDDFLGSTHFVLKREQSIVYREILSLGYNNPIDGFQTDTSYGHITVTVMFRPVSNVEKSERYRLMSVDNSHSKAYLYQEDLVSPSSVGGGPAYAAGRKVIKNSVDDIEGKIFVDLTIIQAKELVGMDRNGLSDPFCEVLVGSKKIFKTAIKNNTLEPKWNESTSFQVTEDTHLLEINVYDKDLISKDFLGKVVLTLEQMKEISHKGTSDWIPLQRTKSGQIQIKCSVICPETVQMSNRRSTSMRLSHQNSGEVFLPSPDSVNQYSIPGPLSESPELSDQQQKDGEPLGNLSNRQEGKIEATEAPMSFMVSPDSLKLPDNESPKKEGNGLDRRGEGSDKLGEVSLQRSVSDVSATRRPEMNRLSPLSNYRHSDHVSDSSGFPDNISLASTVMGVDRLYSVTGHVTQISGLKEAVGKIYIKVRLQNSSSRFRMLSRNVVLAKSSLMPASMHIIDLKFQIDRGGGVNVDTCLIFDVKNEHKSRIAQKTVTLKTLFEENNEGESQWLSLSNGVDIQLTMTQGQPDPRKINKKHHGFKKAFTFSKDRQNLPAT